MRFTAFLSALVLGVVLASTASASQLIDRNASRVSLTVAGSQALITYTAGGQVKHVLASGAINALAPTRARKQVEFSLSYAGSSSIGGRCGAYDGPPLAWRLAACKAPDGSYWALQAWQRGLADYGVAASSDQSAWELRLSHWTGALPVLTINVDWAWRQWDHLYGTLVYAGHPVFGYASTRFGNPLDTFGRNIYVDTFNSVYGQGWRRENSFLTHSPTGAFCYSFNPHASHPAGRGLKYRATVEGPGVTPDVMWEGHAPGPFNPALDQTANAAIAQLHDTRCKPN